MTLPELRAAAPFLVLARLSREMGEESRFLAYVLAGRKRLTAEHERQLDEALASAGLSVRRAA